MVTTDQIKNRRGFAQPQRHKTKTEIKYDLANEIRQAENMIRYYTYERDKADAQLRAIEHEEINERGGLNRGALKIIED